MDSALFLQTIKKIDDFNHKDPHKKELVYSERLTEWVLKLKPDASEALRLAARAQHIGRWTVPRENYPMDRGGYLRWRETLKTFHARTAADILRETGYETRVIDRVHNLILKKNLKEDPETQALEDGLCLLFLESQLAELRHKTPDDKMKEIIRKTWKKMSAAGQKHALALPLPEDAKRLLQQALA